MINRATWTTRGRAIAASFAPGAVIEARALASGSLEIYKICAIKNGGNSDNPSDPAY